ncbi:unnamed protein product [Amaranthus hypochondriacus]
MSSSRGSLASRINANEEISELIFKLQALLPERNHGHLRRVPKDQILKEVCKYIRKLNKEVENMSERISEVLGSVDHIGLLDEDVINTLLQY